MQVEEGYEQDLEREAFEMSQWTKQIGSKIHIWISDSEEYGLKI